MLDPRARGRGIFAPAAVDRLLDESGSGRAGEPLLAVLLLELGIASSSTPTAASGAERPRRARSSSEAGMRVLWLTNMWPDAERPWYGSFVHSQARSLERLLAESQLVEGMKLKGKGGAGTAERFWEWCEGEVRAYA